MDRTVKIHVNLRKRQRAGLGLVTLAMVCLLCACSPGTETVPTVTLPGNLTPYPTLSPQPTLAAVETAAPLILPTPSPTPRQHIVRQGEDMGGIAYRYGVTLAALLAANPDVTPGIMSVGTALVIPPSEGDAPSELPSEPTPVGVTLGAVRCYPMGDTSIWCFLMVANNLGLAVENPAATVRLVDRGSGVMTSARADAPLNLLLPGGSLPLAAYFPPPAPIVFDAAADLSAAIPLAEPGQRYITVRVENTSINIHPNGLAADAAGEIVMDAGEGQASSVWVVLVAYDAGGNMIGLRRWESNAPLSGGQRLPFSSVVYSAGGPIAELKILVEARR